MPATDTTPWAEAAQLRLYQGAGPAGRALIAVELSEAARETTLAGIRRRHPEFSEREVAQSFLAFVYGDGNAHALPGNVELQTYCERGDPSPLLNVIVG